MEPTAPVRSEVYSPLPGNTHPHLARERVALGFLVDLQRPDVRPVASAHLVAHHLLPRPEQYREHVPGEVRERVLGDVVERPGLST